MNALTTNMDAVKNVVLEATSESAFSYDTCLSVSWGRKLNVTPPL